MYKVLKVCDGDRPLEQVVCIQGLNYRDSAAMYHRVKVMGELREFPLEYSHGSLILIHFIANLLGFKISFLSLFSCALS